ncbi:hypothetical protein ACIP97_16870 [Peribacillus frigoritolerans]|uniref:hypothetical protein n=1 Tax=Peribacillus frigoritolerans TaxID=450367 RepID=UPI0037F98FC5
METKLNTETANHQTTKDQLAIKTAEYDAKIKELTTANNIIKNLMLHLNMWKKRLDKLIN